MILTYTKQNFNDGEVLYASQLNNMDNQILANMEAINAMGEVPVADSLNTTISYINDSGRKPIRAMVSFIDDDCRKEVYENIVDDIDCSLLSVIGEKDAEGNISKINIPYMLACPPGDIFDEDTNTGKSGYMTKQQLLNIYNAGVKLTCHHFHQYNMDDTEHFQDIYAYENDLKSCQEKFLSWGINDVNTVSYPQGRYVDEFINTVKKYYKMGFTVTNGINSIPYESYYMKRVGLFADSASKLTLDIVDGQSLGTSGGTVSKSTGVRCEPISVSEGEEYVITCSANWNSACYAFWDSTNTPMEDYIGKSANTVNGTKLVDYRVRVPAGARSMIVGANTVVDPNGTVSISKIANKATIATAKSYVDQVANEGGWLIFMTHAWYKWFNADDLKELIEYIQEKQIEIVGVNEALNATGNVIETGVLRKPLEEATEPYFVVDYRGQAYTNSVEIPKLPDGHILAELNITEGKLINNNKVITAKGSDGNADPSFVVAEPIDVSDCKKVIISGWAYNHGDSSQPGYQVYVFKNSALSVLDNSWRYTATNSYADGGNKLDYLEIDVPDGATTLTVAGNRYQMMPKVIKVYEKDTAVITPQMYGAKGDGVTDDTESIAAAIAELRSGGTLYFPAGVYRVSNINLKSNMTVKGDGWCSVIKLLDWTDDYHGRNNCLNIERIENVIIRDIKLDGNRMENGEYRQQSTASSQDGRLDGLHIRYASDIYIENVWMYNNGYHGCIMTYVTNVIFSNCRASDNGFRPIHGHTQIYNCRVSNCVCENNGLGLLGGSGYENDSVFFFGAKDLVINDNIIKSNRRGCITVGCDQDSTPADHIVPSRNTTISGNICECYADLPYIKSTESDTGVAKFSSMGIQIYGGNHIMENVTVTGNTIKNAHEAIRFYAQENIPCSINATVSGNTILDCSYGIHAVEVSDITISGNQFRNLACAWMYAQTVSNFLIQGNNVNSPGTSERDICQVKYSSENIVILDNNIIGSCANAVYASDSTKNVVVANNVLCGFINAEPIINPNGHTSGNLIITGDNGDDSEYEKICIDPYSNSGFVRATLQNPVTSSDNWRYTTPVEITDADTQYELNTYVTVPVENEPADYDFSSKHTAIVFLNGTELTSAVGIANLSNSNGSVTFSNTCVEGTINNTWGVQIALTAENVKELFPSATHVMMQIEAVYTNPDSLSAGHRAISDGHAYVYRAK